MGPLPAQSALNVSPQGDVFLDNRATREEMKMGRETRKILGVPDLHVEVVRADDG